MKKTWILVITLALVLALLVSCGGTAETETGAETKVETETETATETELETEVETEQPTDSQPQGTVLLSSPNYQVTDRMISYFENVVYADMFYQYLNLYYSYLQDINTAYNYANSMMSQYQLDDFFEQALTYAQESLALCEQAVLQGIALDSADKEEVEKNLASFEGNYEGFGESVTEDDIRRAIEIETLAGKLYVKFQDETPATVTGQEIDEYIQNHKEEFFASQYLEFTVSLDVSEEQSYKDAKALADTYAERLKAAKSDAEFLSLIIHYVVDRDFDSAVQANLSDSVRPDADALAAFKTQFADAIIATLTGSTSGITFDTATEQGAALQTVYLALGSACVAEMESVERTQAYVSSPENSVIRWLTDTDTAAFSTYEVASTTSEQYVRSVYMLTQPLTLVDEKTVNVGHILIEAREGTATQEELEAAYAKAQEVLDTYLAGEKTRDAFEALATEHTADSGVFYDNVTQGMMVSAFDAWIFDQARFVGETAIVKTEFGYHIMYWDGQGENTATTAARTAIVNQKYQALVEQASSSITLNQQAIDALMPSDE